MESERKPWELSESEKQEIEARKKILEYIAEQEEYFKIIMEYVDDLINDMIDNGEIYDYGELRARIKSVKSALKNESKNKAVDDVFGMEIITLNEEDYEKIMIALMGTTVDDPLKYNPELYPDAPMVCTKFRTHDKPDGYKAQHRCLMLKREKLALLGIPEEYLAYVPIVEIQFKTIDTIAKIASGKGCHDSYKQVDMEEIQRKYDMDDFDPTELPKMWVSKERKMVLLDKEATLKKLYPKLRIKKLEKGVQK